MSQGIAKFEECPLQHSQYRKRPRSYKGPLRVVRLCLLGIALPTSIISVPLYLRYHVYANQLYPFAVSDMRLLDRHVSTVWCQKQLVSVNNNATFNAFLLPNRPNVSPAPKIVSMERELLLEDDMKEYWGFYLLAGSTVTVSTCVRWPGASLIMIRGHKHLHECAYIGDDSSEEMDEVLEAMREGVYVNESDTSDSDALANAPQLMKRHHPDVRFHHPLHGNGTDNHSIHYEEVDVSEVTDSKIMKILLDSLSKKTDQMDRQRKELMSRFNKKDEKSGHITGGTSIDSVKYNKNNAKNVDKQVEDKTPSQTIKKLKDESNGRNQNNGTLNRHNEYLSPQQLIPSGDLEEHFKAIPENVKDNRSRLFGMPKPASTINPYVNSIDVGPQPISSSNLSQNLDHTENLQNNLNGTAGNSSKPNKTRVENSENLTSSEEMFVREVFQKLDSLGNRQHKVLQKLNNRAVKNSTVDGQKHVDTVNRKINLEQLRRRKRDLIISTAIANDLSEDDEKGNAAIEEGFTADGIADHRGSFNETTLNDRSNSEFWSSFSSSEEALLNCAGLILNLPLTPHPRCQREQSEERLKDASLANTITYLVPRDGYYFFVFNSENEVQVNYIRVRFQLNKTVYDVSHSVSSCSNSTKTCELDLRFFSAEKTVMEVPVTGNDSLWNEEFVVVSQCEPRTMIYVCCVLSVPILILLFAFQ